MNVIVIERSDESINDVWDEIQQMMKEYGYDLSNLEPSYDVVRIDAMALMHLNVPSYRITDGTAYMGDGFGMIRINYHKEIKIRGVQHYGLIIEVDSDVLAVQLKLRYM
jgi:hypothetical protein